MKLSKDILARLTDNSKVPAGVMVNGFIYIYIYLSLLIITIIILKINYRVCKHEKAEPRVKETSCIGYINFTDLK